MNGAHHVTLSGATAIEEPAVVEDVVLETLARDQRATAVARRIIARRDPLRTEARHDPFLRLLLAEAYLEGLADGSRERGQ